jgi:hypothetical protein
MFVLIEGDSAIERKAKADTTRNETLNRLWEIACCEQNVFNKTIYLDT